MNYYDGATAITSFFNSLAGGTANPRITWLAANEATKDLDSTEGSVLTAQAAAINAFVGSGGGLMAHGAADSVAQGWLTTLLLGIVLSPECSVGGLLFTGFGFGALGFGAIPGRSFGATIRAA